jgi:ubiquinone/menaquinone biosynthesis C-methylase UbiE
VSLRPEDPVVDENVAQDHYGRLAATYDENWTYSPAFVEWMTDSIQQRLRITDGDLVADIGCGTGLFARGLAPRAAAVVCADPSGPMLAQVPVGERLIAVTASAQDIAAGRVVLPHDGYDAMLLKEMLHHVDDRSAVITGLSRLLRPGGRMLVVMLPKRISYPLFAAALKLFTAQQPDSAEVAAEMRSAGMDVELTYGSLPLIFPTERYLQMVRNRYMSLLSHFDDAQLEAGVAEIQRANPAGKIAFTDTFAFILGTAA